MEVLPGLAVLEPEVPVPEVLEPEVLVPAVLVPAELVLVALVAVALVFVALVLAGAVPAVFAGTLDDALRLLATGRSRFVLTPWIIFYSRYFWYSSYRPGNRKLYGAVREELAGVILRPG